MELNEAQCKVQLFHKIFQHPVGDFNEPSFLNKERALLRSKWMLEEIMEFNSAMSVVDQIDALTDQLYFLLGTLVEMGVRPEVPFQIVHSTNMAKIGAIKREDGKTGKPFGWIPPEQKIAEYIYSIRKR